MPAPAQFIANNKPSVLRHDKVVTQIEVFDVDPDTMPPKVMTELYEAGYVLVFKNAKLDMSDEDWHFFNSLNPPASNDNWLKKAKASALLAPVDGTHVLVKLGLSEAQAERLRQIIGRVNKQLRDRVTRWFPNYKVVNDQSVTWRLTPTESEEMHYDSYGKSTDDNHNVRLFVNLDSKPRLWGVGNPIDETIRIYRDRLKSRSTEHPNLFNGAVNNLLPWPEVARHFVTFAPLNMWLVNSQLIAHEIIYGRRMIAGTYACEEKSMHRPELSFVNRVRKAWA